MYIHDAPLPFPQGNFEPGEGGTIMKKSSCNELESLRGLMCDELRPFVPEFVKEVEKNGQSIQCYSVCIMLE